MLRFRLAALVCVVSFVLATQADDVPTIEAADAAKHAGKVCAVQFVVKSTAKVKSKNGPLIILSSAKNRNDSDSLNIVIDESITSKLSAGGISAPHKYYANKQVAITGLIEPHKGSHEIRLTNPSALKVTNAKPASDPNDAPSPVENQPDDYDPTPPSYLPYYVAGGFTLLLVIALVLRKVINRNPSEG